MLRPKLNPGGQYVGSPHDQPECYTTPTFSNCTKVGPDGCESGTWTCPVVAGGVWFEGRYLTPHEVKCYERLQAIRAKAVELDLNFKIVDRSNYCVPPVVTRPKRSGFGGFLKNIEEGLTSGDWKQVLGTAFSIAFPGYQIPVLQQATLVEQAFTAGTDEIGLDRSHVELGIDVATAIYSGNFSAAAPTAAGSLAQGAKPMAGFFDDILGGIGNFFSGTSFSDVLNIATPVATAFLQPDPVQQVRSNTPAQSFVPTYNALQFGVPNTAVAQPVMSGGVVMPAMGSMVARMVAPVLFKISQTVGRSVSLQKALTMARSLGRQLQSPAAAAAALGITLAELAQLIVAGQHRKRRRMNPANSGALRRAARRIESFHRLCARTDMLRSRGRRRSASRCGSCKKSPCRC